MIGVYILIIFILGIGQMNRCIPIVFPGYRDIYEEAEVHDSYGSIDYRDGETFAETLESCSSKQ